MIKAGIIGGAGYTGGELIRLLINHPAVEIAFVNSSSNAGGYVYDVHTDLFGDTDLRFTNEVLPDIDVLFLCVAHGDARKFLAANPIPSSVKIIDLSQDFRIKGTSPDGAAFVYGLPEINKQLIYTANYIANPGCFATCLQLGLLPLAANGLLTDELHITGVTGSTGAGQKPGTSTHFSWRSNNLSTYKAFEHQHLKEITQSVVQLQPSYRQAINFIPYRGDFARGIIATIHTKFSGTEQEAVALYQKFYEGQPFTHVSTKNIDLKQVVNTNKCLVYVEKHGDYILVTSIIDNLLKGASGQAVQNMNLMFGLDETTGLKLKAVAF
jgi:N-acetyl-gamma-glutamyl-phosphate reductase